MSHHIFRTQVGISTSILGNKVEITNELNGSHFEDSLGNQLKHSPMHFVTKFIKQIHIKKVYVPAYAPASCS